MTATLLALLVAEEKVKWSTTLGEIFGRAMPTMHEAWKGVPLQLVLGHRAGFPANIDPAKRKRDFPAAPLAELRRSFAADALAAAPQTTPGGKFEYSNTGYIILGAALEQITQTLWEDLMRERLFAPLGIATGGFGAPGKPGELDEPWGHRDSGTAVDPGSPGADNPRIYGPAGTAHMAIGDWAKFIALHLRGDPENPHHEARLLSRAAFAHLHAPVDGAAQGYACGWGVLARDWARGSAASATGRVLSHAGSNTMWHAVAWLAPEIDFALLACCNRGGERAGQACNEAVGVLLRHYAR
jgi:CubicO group peptidase (beta-lactamase class C family)